MRRVFFTSVAALIFLAGNITTAYAVGASSVVDSGGVIHGCIGNTAIRGTHVLLLHDVGRVCPRGTSELDWSERGPMGSVGSPGPAGPAGAAGAAGSSTLGPDGLDVVVVQVTTENSGVATAECPADHPYAISGGGSVFNPPINFVGTPAAMAASLPVSSVENHPDGWTVVAVDTASNPSPTGQVSGVAAYAECVK